jgi:hypothetical protein
MDNQGFGVQLPGRARNILHTISTGSGAQQPPNQWVQGSPSEGKACEVNYWHLFSAETKNAWSYTSIMHILEQYSINHITGLYFLSNITVTTQKLQIILYKFPHNEIAAASHHTLTISAYKYVHCSICAVVTTFRLYLQHTYVHTCDA